MGEPSVINSLKGPRNPHGAQNVEYNWTRAQCVNTVAKAIETNNPKGCLISASICFVYLKTWLVKFIYTYKE